MPYSRFTLQLQICGRVDGMAVIAEGQKAWKASFFRRRWKGTRPYSFILAHYLFIFTALIVKSLNHQAFQNYYWNTKGVIVSNFLVRTASCYNREAALIKMCMHVKDECVYLQMVTWCKPWKRSACKVLGTKDGPKSELQNELLMISTTNRWAENELNREMK